jgi:hypothetical protein
VLLIVTADADPYRSSRLTGRVTSEWASTGDIPAEWRSRCRRRSAIHGLFFRSPPNPPVRFDPAI